MSDQQLDRILAAASPVTDDDIAALDLSSAESELMEDIVMLDTRDIADVAQPRRRFRRRIIGSVTAVAAISLIVAGIVTSTGTKSEFSPAAVRVAEANPRILVDAAGWKVTRADEFTVSQGEMTFANGTQSVDLHWRPASEYNGYKQDRGDGNESKQITVLGEQAIMYRYAGTTDYTTILPAHRENFVEIRGDLGGEAPYRAVLDSLEKVDVDTWLAAMPASVVKPVDRAATVDEMLRGIPLPHGFDASKLRSGDEVKDRYQLGAQVSGAVACAWLDQWTSGGSAQRTEAVAAMKTSHDWRVLHQMDPEGDYPEVLWEMADGMGSGKVSTGAVLTRGFYAPALGCTE